VTDLLGIEWVHPYPPEAGGYVPLPKSWGIFTGTNLIVIEGGVPGGVYGAYFTFLNPTAGDTTYAVLGPLTLPALDGTGNGYVQGTDLGPGIPDVKTIASFTWVHPGNPSTADVGYVHLPTAWGINPTHNLVIIEGGLPGHQYQAWLHVKI
jgi:hypothetical protein